MILMVKKLWYNGCGDRRCNDGSDIGADAGIWQ